MSSLGEVQRGVLQSLKEHGSWYEMCGWSWDTNGGTRRVLESLCKRGLVQVTRNSEIRVGDNRVWTLTMKGKRLLEESS